MACRLIKSPITGEQVTSKTWNDIYELTGQNEQEADKLYEQLLSPEFLSWFGNWVEPNKPKVVLPIGTSGSGKSTWINSLSNDYIVISPDDMRIEFTGDINNKSRDKDIYEEVKIRAVNAIKDGKQVIIDSTNLQKERRRDFLSYLRNNVPEISIEYKLMELNPELAKKRIKAQIKNGEPRANVPDDTIDRHALLYAEAVNDIKEESLKPFKEDIKTNVSKVVNDIGEPLILYHGDRSGNFKNTFSKEFIGINEIAADFGKSAGFYFSNNKKVAESYSKKNVFPVFLSIKDLKKVGINNPQTKEEYRKELEDSLNQIENSEIYDGTWSIGSTQYIYDIDDYDFVVERSGLSYTEAVSSNKEKQPDEDIFFSQDIFLDKESKEEAISTYKERISNIDKEYKEVLKTGWSDIKQFIKDNPNHEGYVLENTLDVFSVSDEYISDHIGDTYVTNIPNTIKSVFNQGQFSPLSDNIYLSSSTNLLSSKASEPTLEFVKEFLKRIGVDLETLSRNEMRAGLASLKGYDGKSVAYGIADTVNKIAWILEGKEDVALTEETMHFAVSIIKEKNPTLYKQMFNAIGQYQITKDVIADEGYRRMYQTSDGKPDITKLKEEAMGKILAEYVIQGLEGRTEKPDLIARVQSWWKQILEWFGEQFAKVGLNITNNPFQTASESIIGGTFEGTAEDIQDREIMLSLGPDSSQSDIYNKIKATSNTIQLIDKEYINKETGQKVSFRVSQIKEQKKKGKFPDRTESQKASDDESAAFGTKGHSDIEDIAKRYINEDGYIRKDENGNVSPLPQINPSQLSPNDNSFYEQLESNFKERLLEITDNLSKDTRFLIETIMYDNSNPNRDIAGTVDFMSIQEDGQVDIYDWKFMENTDKKTGDVIHAKKEDFNLQLSEYKRILSKVYGVSNIRRTRAVPIIVKYNYNSGIKTPISISISGVNVNVAQFDYELPVPIQSERTGNPAIDKQIDKLQALYKRINSTDAVEGRKFAKNEQLNQLSRTIRHLQIKQDLNPTLNYVNILHREVDNLVDTYNNKYANGNPSDFGDEEISHFMGRILDTFAKYVPFEEILTLKQTNPEDKEFINKINEVNSEVQENAGKGGRLNKLIFDFGSKYLAQRNNVKDLLTAEKEYKGVAAWLRPASLGGTSAVNTFYNIVSKYQNKIQVEQNIELGEYEQIATNFREWANKKGLSPKNMFNLIFEKSPSDPTFNNKRIDTIDKEFFTQFNKAVADRDHNWIFDNIDIEKYQEDANVQKEKEIQAVKSFTYDIDSDKNLEEQSRRIEYINSKYNFSTEKSSGWFQNDAKHYPTEQWYSKEYKELTKPENKPALDLFNYIGKVVDEAASLGMISRNQQRKFLPFVRKFGIAEKLIYNDGASRGVSLTQNLFDSITIQEDDYGYGYRDPVTGEVIYDLKARYTSDFLLDERPEDLSTNLLETMRRFSDEIIRYRNLSTINDQIKGLLEIEKLKNSIQTNAFGKILTENGIIMEQDNNLNNYKILFDFYLSNFLGIEGAKDDFLNKTFGSIPENWQNNFDKVNKLLGVNVLPTDTKDRKFSVVKTIDGFRKYFQLKTLGFNVAIPFSNFIGGGLQAAVNAGDYYDTKEAMLYDTKVASLAFSGKNDNVSVELIKILEPYVEIFEQDKKRKVTASKIGDFSFIQDIALFPYRSTRLIEIKHALAMFNNAIVIDGNVINVNQYLKQKYNNRYDVPYQDRQKLLQQIESEKKQLLKDNGLINNTRIVNNKLQLPDNLTLTSPSLLKYRDITTNLAKQFLGASTSEDRNRANTNSLFRTFLVFKNWLPPLLEPRISEIKYAQGTNRWEYGRTRAFVKAWFKGGIFKVNRLRDLYLMNDDGTKMMGEILTEHKIKYKEKTGKELDITKAEYIDLYQRAIKNATKDVLFYATIVGIVVSASSLLEDDDDPETKGYSTFALRMLNKVREEFEFYYSPSAMIDIANGSVMPPLSVVYDFSNLLRNIANQGYGFIVDDEELMESAKPLKYALRLSPITNNLMYYSAVASPDIAHSLGVQITSQARSRR